MSEARPAGLNTAHGLIDRVLVRDGRRGITRLMEDVQAAYLFGQFPPDSHAPGAIDRIIAANPDEVSRLAETWLRFVERGKRFYGKATYDRGFLESYMAYYCSLNVPKIQAVLTELLRRGAWRPETGAFRVLDLGVGPGTAFLAIADWLLLYRAAAGAERFPTALEWYGADQSEEALEATRRTAALIAAALERWTSKQPPSPAAESCGIFDAWHRVATACRAARLTRADLTAAPPPELLDAAAEADLIIASYVLNEVRDAERDTEYFDRLIDAARPGALVVVVEPGDRNDASGLMAWRRAFLRQRRDWKAVVPCGEVFGSNLPPACDWCWPLSREPFRAPPLYAAIVERLPEGVTRPLDGQAGVLSWSYTVLRRAERQPPRGRPNLSRLPGDYESTVIARVTLSDTAGDSSGNDGSRRDGIEFVKICPEEVGASSEARLNLPSREMPAWVTVGRRVRMSGFDVAPGAHGSVEFVPRAGWRLEPADSPPPAGSLVGARVDTVGANWLDYVLAGSLGIRSG